mgnify:CR=1 FL=1
MSANTIKLSSALGDQYISSQQTLVYKNITLFGYGYLDWGTVVNQALVNLIDKIDLLQDGGVSEIQFDLTQYEETQKVLRAEEFNTWKSGFKTILNDLVQGYIDDTKKAIEDLKTAQAKINTDTSDLINSNYKTLDQKLTDLTSTLDEKILEIVNTQLGSVTETVNTLSGKVDKAVASLDSATQTINSATQEVKQTIETFKTEFSKSFETFKSETSKALEENKNYLVKYIDQKIFGLGNTTSNLETRIAALEMISDSMDPSYVQNLIIQKVSTISEGIIAGYLNNFDNRITIVENKVTNLENNLDSKISEKVDSATSTLTTALNAQNGKISDINKKVNDLNTEFEPLSIMKQEIEAEYGDVPHMIEVIGETEFNTLDDKVLLYGLGRSFKTLTRNLLLKQIDQEKTNLINIINFINAGTLNFLEGMKNTAFDELSIIKRYDLKTTLINSYFDFVQGNLENYSNSELKFNGLFAEVAHNKLDFAFSLPGILQSDSWGIGGIEIKNNRTGEAIESNFLFSDGIVSNHLLEYYNTSFKVNGNIPTQNINPFSYYTNFNTSGLVNVTFYNGLLATDNVTIKIFKNASNSQLISSKTIAVSEFEKIGNIDTTWINGNFTDLYKSDMTLTKPTGLGTFDLVHSTQNNYVLVPVNKIVTKNDGSKVFNIKISLPVGATLTKIDFNDETSTTTKTFTNQETFPTSTLDYNNRKLGNTDNYYKDIGTTGLLWYPISSSATTVKTTITYVINGTTKTEDINTGGTSSSKSKIVTATISSANYLDIDITSLFGAGTDSTYITVEPRIQESTSSSDVYGKFIKADHVCSVVWISSSIIRIYNEYTSNLSFQILLRS